MKPIQNVFFQEKTDLYWMKSLLRNLNINMMFLEADL